MNTDPSRQEQNPYQYSLSNPLLHTDPSGLDAWWCGNLSDPEKAQQCYRDNAISQGYLVDYTKGVETLWDTNYITCMTIGDRIAAEQAYIRLLSQPEYYIKVFITRREEDSLNYALLEMFAENSIFHTSAHNLILNTVYKYYGYDAEQALMAIEARTRIAEFTGNPEQYWDDYTAGGISMSSMALVNYWYKSTFKSESLSIEYHFKNHAPTWNSFTDPGQYVSKQRYTLDAINFWEDHQIAAFDWDLGDGTIGKKIDLGAGNPVGIYKDGKVVSFDYGRARDNFQLYQNWFGDIDQDPGW